MSIRAFILLLLLAGPAFGQVDVLTGEPAPPRRNGAIITNAPHAPRQMHDAAQDYPIEVYVAPQLGTGLDGTGITRSNRRN